MPPTHSTTDNLLRLIRSTSGSPDGREPGWVSGPDVRGTWDIIWTSSVTIFICTFTVLCLNVPAKNDSVMMIARRRLFWMLLAVLAPEIVLSYAAGQWSRARHSVRDFHDAGHAQWTMWMAFFADMGGFILQAEGCEPFPLNAKQLHWLIVNEHIDCPVTNVDEIWDKSKQDRFARLVTTFQVSYTIIHAIGRAAQHLAITILELNTLGIVVCSLMTAFAWLHKPADVRTPIHITTSANIGVITGNRRWKTTPLDFVDENGPGWAINVQPSMPMPVIPSEWPIQRIPNDRFPMDPHGAQEYCLCFATLLFTSIHVAGWNFSFPTDVEKILWRVSSRILPGVTAAFCILETAASWIRLQRWKWLYLWLAKPGALPEFKRTRDEKLQRAATARAPVQLPLAWEFWTISVVAFLYGLARIYTIVESFLELRYVDKTAFDKVQWANYIPHV